MILSILLVGIANAQVTWTQVDSAMHPFVAAGSGVLGNYLFCFGAQFFEVPCAQAFNLTTEQWEESTIAPRGLDSYGSATTDEAIYLFGWYDGGTNLGANVQKFTPTGGGPAGVWTQMAPYPIATCDLAAAWDGGNYIYAAGGYDIGYSNAYRYDIAVNSWTPIADMPNGEWGCGGAFVNGKFYVVGGVLGEGHTLFEYDPGTNAWAVKTGPPVGVTAATYCTTFNDSLVFTVGGGQLGYPLLDAVQIYNPVTDTWTLETPLPQSIHYNTARFVPPDKVISAGGCLDYYTPWLSDTYLGTGFPGGATSVPPEPSNPNPADFSLQQNYPNPFNPTTTISYYLPAPSNIRVDIYNLLGQRVETLFNGRQEGGVHSVRWDASDAVSGIYFAQLQSQNLTQTRKMLLIR